jgi:menaquinone-dependent protoporphyrinogen oxidase
VRVLVAYASRFGATGEIAEHIAERMRSAGHDTSVESVANAPDVAAYNAFVVGSAVYLGRWQKEATEFVQRNRTILADRPTWLFSSGPLGTDQTDAKGRDKREGALLADETKSLTEAVHPRGHRVFFGVLNPDRLGLGPRLMRLTPAGRKLLEEGDFRDWADIDAWTDQIAGEMAQTKVPAGARA